MMFWKKISFQSWGFLVSMLVFGGVSIPLMVDFRRLMLATHTGNVTISHPVSGVVGRSTNFLLRVQ